MNLKYINASNIDLKKIIACIDLTRLNKTDAEKDIVELCAQAKTPLGYVASVCVYPEFVALARKMLNNTPVNIATVINFPKGNLSLENITADIQQSLLDGASELDIVMPFLYHSDLYQSDLYYANADIQTKSNPNPNLDFLSEFIQYCKNLCHIHAARVSQKKILLKMILETGVLSPVQIKTISQIAIDQGIDFLKTSTGKIAQGADPQSAKIILKTIKNSGQAVGFKVSGGIGNVEQVKMYVQLVEKILGKNAFCPAYFRIGASSLLKEILHANP